MASKLLLLTLIQTCFSQPQQILQMTGATAQPTSQALPTQPQLGPYPGQPITPMPPASISLQQLFDMARQASSYIRQITLNWINYKIQLWNNVQDSWRAMFSGLQGTGIGSPGQQQLVPSQSLPFPQQTSFPPQQPQSPQQQPPSSSQQQMTPLQQTAPPQQKPQSSQQSPPPKEQLPSTQPEKETSKQTPSSFQPPSVPDGRLSLPASELSATKEQVDEAQQPIVIEQTERF